MILEGIKKFYEEKYKALMIIPFLILFFALAQISIQYAQTGEFMHRGVSLKGGISIAIPNQFMPLDDLENILSEKFPNGDISVRSIADTGLIIDTSDVSQKDLIAALEDQFGPLKDYSIGEIGSSLGESFFKETFFSLLIAFVLMSIVVFITFRSPIPSLAVILAAFSDIVVTLAVVNLLGIKVSSAGIAAFLMLIGYSVDTDILLSTRVLKQKEGTVMSRIYSSIKTGLCMTTTTLTALIAGLFFSNSDTILQIMLILFIGLIVDLPMTWIQNTGILRWYLERKGVQK